METDPEFTDVEPSEERFGILAGGGRGQVIIRQMVLKHMQQNLVPLLKL